MVSNIDMALSDVIKTSRSVLKNKNIKRKNGKKPTGIQKKTRPIQTERIRKTPLIIPGNPKRTVRLNLSNLASSVTTSDLNELFGDYKIRSLSVNFDENRTPLGTADISLTKQSSDRLIQQFSGVKLDGKVIKFAVIDTFNIASRVDFRGRKTEFIPKAIQKKQTHKKVDNKKKKNQTKKPEKTKKTMEELDAELDAYMNTSN
uniref:RRM domain-containing protein n=2 Tax=Caenorhabditis japonica TaxID=281687 RepID=A0A8R1EKR3_CAEJA